MWAVRVTKPTLKCTVCCQHSDTHVRGHAHTHTHRYWKAQLPSLKYDFKTSDGFSVCECRLCFLMAVDVTSWFFGLHCSNPLPAANLSYQCPCKQELCQTLTIWYTSSETTNTSIIDCLVMTRLKSQLKSQPSLPCPRLIQSWGIFNIC